MNTSLNRLQFDYDTLNELLTLRTREGIQSSRVPTHAHRWDESDESRKGMEVSSGRRRERSLISRSTYLLPEPHPFPFREPSEQ
jgi:hypothetical protein